ncbi:MAG: DUF2608 domain-containing protein [Sphingobacteriia bacterium]|nr:DUF2608 domain-containing protein [Sphingobacteriia bacterium]
MIKINEYSQLIDFISNTDILILDIDDTVFSTFGYGSIKWFTENVKFDVETKNISRIEAVQYYMPLWEEAQHSIEVMLTDPLLPQLIDDLKEKGTKILGLTARRHNHAEVTLKQLDQVQIKFDNFLNFTYDSSKLLYPVEHVEGIVFCSEYNTKGEVLKEVLKQNLQYAFKKLLFVDDLEYNIDSVKKHLNNFDIEFHGFHFTKLNNYSK